MKKLYKQFNHLKIDMNMDPMEVSTLEKERIKRNVMKVKKKKHLTRNFVAAAAFLVTSSISIGYAFPTFAANIPVVGNIFGLFVDDEKYVFEKHDEYSTSIGTTQESNDVEVTVTDAVYDGENITIAYTIKSEKRLGERPILEGEITADEFENRYEHSGFDNHYIVKKINDKEYAVLYIYELIKGPKPEKVQITFQGNKIVDLNNVNNEITGDWSFEFTLEKLASETKVFEKGSIKTEAEGTEVIVRELTETPISTTLKISELVDMAFIAKEEEAWRGVLIEYKVSDNLGNEYNIVQYRGTGHSTDFNDLSVSHARITTNRFDEKATSIMITPVVGIYKMKDSEGSLELIKEPYKIEPIIVPIK
ncbi:DUF4179 domain-containing protein [Viridibacillus sp. FSL R5-0888]|uniref:DUF4179 domain-containing protein n=1 Tax=Viridibacillus sp. FSL R5-0888 TaxID=2921663 RepID=UPI0030F4D077